MLHVVMSVLMPWVEQHMWMFSFRLQCLCSPDSALCRIVEILDPGLLLDRIEEPLVGTHISPQIARQIPSKQSRIIQSDAEDLEADFS